MKAKPSTPAEPPAPPKTGVPEAALRAASARHLRIGWWSLLVYLTLGLILEGLHGFKVGFYLNVSNETRRLMWTLAHAHGTLIALVQIAFALTLRLLPLWDARQRALAGHCLIGANLLLPGGFFLGGLFLYGGDPGLGVLLVPLGAVLLFLAVFLTARALTDKPLG
jgi:hypothetical protein